jgi:hypothetical protein
LLPKRGDRRNGQSEGRGGKPGREEKPDYP